MMQRGDPMDADFDYEEEFKKLDYPIIKTRPQRLDD